MALFSRYIYILCSSYSVHIEQIHSNIHLLIYLQIEHDKCHKLRRILHIFDEVLLLHQSCCEINYNEMFHHTIRSLWIMSQQILPVMSWYNSINREMNVLACILIYLCWFGGNRSPCKRLTRRWCEKPPSRLNPYRHRKECLARQIPWSTVIIYPILSHAFCAQIM